MRKLVVKFRFLLIITIDVILLVKYAFIFWLKNPAAVMDEFWMVFLRFWIVGYTCLSQLIYFFLPGRQALHFYICNGIFPVDEQLLPNKPRWHSITVLSVSIIFCIIITCRIKLYGRKLPHEESSNNISIIKTLEKSIFESKGSFVVAILALLIVLAFIFLNNTLNPLILNQYPYFVYYWIVYAVPKLLVSSLWLFIIFQKDSMRHLFFKVAWSFIMQFK